MARGHKRLYGIAAALATGTVIAAALWPRTPAPEPAPEPAAAPAPDASAPAAAAPVPVPEAVVSAVTGRVERFRGGDWAVIGPGERLRSQDALRAGSQSSADLEIGSSGRVRVGERTELRVDELSQAVHGFRLERGRVALAYEADGERVVRLEGPGGAVAETRAARFSATSNRTSFAIATETGRVNLKAAGASVEIDAGRQAVASAGRPPSPAEPIPVELLLKVAAASRTRQGPCTIEGTASPGAEVFVANEPAEVDPQGRFLARIPAGSAEPIRVVMRDVAGRIREERLRCRRPRPPPSPPPGSIDGMQIRWRE